MTKKQQRSPAKQPVSTTTIWLAAIASTLVVIILYIGLFWIDNQASTTTFSEAPSEQTELSRNGLIVFSLAVGALVLGPGILVALIVLPALRKNKKK